ncbi:MAG: hypothetical protein QXF46_00165 [Thermofilaceae archaeon]
MSTLHLRNALGILESLLQRDDVNAELKKLLQQVRMEIIQAQDEALWARSRAREAYHVLEELVELLGAEVRSTKVRVRGGELDYIGLSPYFEAVVNEDGKVKIEKVAVAQKKES